MVRAEISDGRSVTDVVPTPASNLVTDTRQSILQIFTEKHCKKQLACMYLTRGAYSAPLAGGVGLSVPSSHTHPAVGPVLTQNCLETVRLNTK